MTTLQIDRLNIGLIILSLICAFLLPFWLFLASYAVLGPLHYLTEISWLKEKNYFIKGRTAPIALTILCSIAAIAFIAQEANIASQTTGVLQSIIQFFIGFRIEIVIASFVGTVGFFIFKKSWQGLLFLSICLATLAFIPQLPYPVFMLGVFIPTVLHVYIFTALFMLWGALKSGSKTGLIAFSLVLACLIPIIMVPDSMLVVVKEGALDVLVDSGLYQINAYIASIFGYSSRNGFELTPLIIRVQVFLAFIYTYHFLNWFSKTGIIRWHSVPRFQLILTFVIWIASVGLYFYNYRYGIVVLFFLSLLHVFVEFPLNVVSFMEIPKLLKGYRRK